MKFAIVIGCLALVACGERYQYVERNGASLRIDSAGHVSVLKVTNGATEWVALPTKEEAAIASEKRRAHCVESTLPSDEAGLVVFTANNESGGLTVTNKGNWCVREIRFQDGLVAQPSDGQACPGRTTEFMFADARYPNRNTLTTQAVVGTPGDCATF